MATPDHKQNTMDQQQRRIMPSPHQAKGFGDLPPELAEMVIKELPMLELANIVRTCSDLRRLAEPYLYTEVNYTFALLRTISNRPELAKHVKVFSYNLLNTPKLVPQMESDRALLKAAREEARSRFNAGEQRQRPDHEWDWNNGGEEMYWLLLRFINLRTLRHGPTHGELQMRLSILLNALRPRLSEPQDFFPGLKNLEVEVGSATGQFFTRCEYEAVLGSLDSLVLKCQQRVCTPPFFLLYDLQQQSSLTKLAVDWVPEAAGLVECLVNISPQLTEFRWYSWMHSLQYQQYSNLGALGAGLRKARKLERVDIRLRVLEHGDSFTGGSAEAGNEWGMVGTLGSFKGFEHLEELRIPICAMFGWQVPEVEGIHGDDWLPTSLRTLTLTQGLGDMHNYQWTPGPTAALCRGLLSGARTRLPGLQRLSIRRQERKVWLQPDDAIWRELFEAAAAEGVECDASQFGGDEEA